MLKLPLPLQLQRGGTVTSGDGFEEFPSDIATIPGSTYAFLFVTTDEGVTVTVSKGQKILPTQTCISGEELLFEIPESGTWTVSGSNDFERSVIISERQSYYCKISPSIYGVYWDRTSSPVLTRTDSAAQFIDPSPSIAGGTGSSPFDSLYPWSEMNVETINGNEMVKIPKFWYKWYTENGNVYIKIADTETEGFRVSPVHDVTGKDVVYIGRYKCSPSGQGYKSISGYYPTEVSDSDILSSNGEGFSNQSYEMWFTIRLLYIVEFANWESTKVIGYNYGDYIPSSSYPSLSNTGSTDSMQYHTGTMALNRSTITSGLQYRNIESPYGNGLESINNFTVTTYSGNYTYYYFNINGNRIATKTYISSSMGYPTSGWATTIETYTYGSNNEYLCIFPFRNIPVSQINGSYVGCTAASGQYAGGSPMYQDSTGDYVSMFTLIGYSGSKYSCTCSRLMYIPPNN